MKKQLILIMIIVVLMTVLTGCSVQKEDNDHNNTHMKQGDDQDAVTVNTDDTEPKSAFQIALNGENEAVFTLTHEAVGKLETVWDGVSGRIVNEINIELYSDNNEDYISLGIRDGNFIVCEWISSETKWLYDSANDNQIETEWSDNAVSGKIKHLEIADILSKYTDYRVVYYVLEGDNETLEEGNLADIIMRNSSQEANNLQIALYDDDTVKFKIYGEDVKTGFYNYKNIYVRLYENEEQISESSNKPTIEFLGGQGNQYTGRGTVYAYTYTEEDNMMVGHDMAGDEIGYNNVAVASDYGIAMKYQYEGISNLIGNTTMYEVYCDDDLMYMGLVEDAVIEKEKEYNIDSIPETFPTNDMDAKYFIPETDNYRITMLEVPYLIDIPVWYRRMGVLVYGATGEMTEQHIATIVMLESYDEFGLLNVKTKIVYEDYVQALYAGTDSGNIILDPQPRISEIDDSLITEELMDNFSRLELYDNPYYSHWYSYLGRFENIKYFEEDFDAQEAHNAIPIIIPLTYCSEGRWYLNQQNVSIFDSLQFEPGEVMQSTNTIFADYTMSYEEFDFDCKITTYSNSTSTENVINYEEEAKEYNTAPEDWRDHPYATFLPELPQGVMVNYTPTNNEQLNLGTDSDGCTREQALEFIGNMRAIEYTEIRYETESDEEIVYIIGVGNDIYIGANWRKDLQSMSIFGYKD